MTFKAFDMSHIINHIDSCQCHLLEIKKPHQFSRGRIYVSNQYEENPLPKCKEGVFHTYLAITSSSFTP